MRTITFQARYLAYLAPFTSLDETRYYLAGVNVEPSAAGGVILTASDGYRAGMFHDAGGTMTGDFGDRDAIIPVRSADGKALVKLCRLAKDTAQRITLTINDSEDRLLDDFGAAGEVRAILIDGRFPDIRRCLPTSGPARAGHQPGPSAYNAEHLNDFGFGPRTGIRRRTMSIKIIPNPAASAGPSWVIRGGYPEFVGAIMPCRMAETIDRLPAWADRPRPDAAA